MSLELRNDETLTIDHIWDALGGRLVENNSLSDLLKGQIVSVGDRVEAPKHGRGTVLAIVGDNAWVQTEVKDYPLTFDLKKLKKVPKPRKGILGVIQSKDWYGNKNGTVYWDVEAVELTPEVRERLKDLL